MTWTYAPANVGSSSLSWVRLRIGDTSSGSQQFSDEEINALVADAGDKCLGAAMAAESLGGQYARKTDKTIGRLRIAMQQASEHYFTLANRLRAEAGSHAGLYAGGISASDKDEDETDSDRVEPGFKIGQYDYDTNVDSTDA